MVVSHSSSKLNIPISQVKQDTYDAKMSQNQETMYEVRWSQQLGRYLVASRDIEPCEIIIREDPIVTGPTDRGPKDIPVCLGCCSVMYDNPSNRCFTCHWPVCNENCEKLPSHALNECQLFHKNRVLYPPPNGWPYFSKSIVILRCLLLKTTNPSNWDLLKKMSDNKEIRKGKPNCINSDKKVLENFAKFMPEHASDANGGARSSAPGNEQGILEEEVIRVSGIIDTNAHAFPLSIKGRSTFICNIYSKTSLLAHSCLPNASWSPDKSLSSLTLTIRANVVIAKGDMISVAYDDGQLLVCTLKRLVPNEINGMFICNCERCLDPTELGTYIGALKCPSCQIGYLLPVDPVDSFSSWKCDNGNTKTLGRPNKKRENGDEENSFNGDPTLRKDSSPCSQDIDRTANSGDKKEEKDSGNCDQVLDDESIMEIMEEAESLCGYTKLSLGSAPSSEPQSSGEQDERENDDDSLSLLKEFEKVYSGNILHPNHYILQEVNVRILKGDYAKGLSSLSDSDLIQFLERCESLLEIANVLTPGFCEYRAFLQFHFSQGLISLERRKEVKSKDRKQHSYKKGAKGKGETSHHTDVDDDDDILKQESSDDAGDQNGNGVGSRKQTKEEENCYAKYGNSQNNLERLMEMLAFLLAFFREINSEHKLLEPIADTIEDTEIKLVELTREDLK